MLKYDDLTDGQPLRMLRLDELMQLVQTGQLEQESYGGFRRVGGSSSKTLPYAAVCHLGGRLFTHSEGEFSLVSDQPELGDLYEIFVAYLRENVDLESWMFSDDVQVDLTFDQMAELLTGAEYLLVDDNLGLPRLINDRGEADDQEVRTFVLTDWLDPELQFLIKDGQRVVHRSNGHVLVEGQPWKILPLKKVRPCAT